MAPRGAVATLYVHTIRQWVRPIRGSICGKRLSGSTAGVIAARTRFGVSRLAALAQADATLGYQGHANCTVAMAG